MVPSVCGADGGIQSLAEWPCLTGSQGFVTKWTVWGKIQGQGASLGGDTRSAAALGDTGSVEGPWPLLGVEAAAGGRGGAGTSVCVRVTELVCPFVLQMPGQFQRLEVTCPGPPASELLKRG